MSWYKTAKLEDKIKAVIKRYPGNGIKLWILDKPKTVFVSFGDWADDIGRFLKELRIAVGGAYEIKHDFEVMKMDKRPWRKIANQQVIIDTRLYESSLRAKLEGLTMYRQNRQQEVMNYKFDANKVQSILQGYSYPNIQQVNQAVSSQNAEAIFQAVYNLYSWRGEAEKAKTINYQQSNEIWEAARSLRTLAEQLEHKAETNPEITEQEITKTFNDIVAGTRQNLQVIAQSIQQTIARIPNWNNSIIRVVASELYNNDDYLEPIDYALIEFGDDDMAPSFSYFSDNGKIIIDDVLEAGDSDFFTESKTQADYFNLIKELRNPGSSSQGGKILTLYTARPVKDRELYDNAKQVPSNLFLTNNYDSAEGIARDLAGSGEVRDVWKIQIDSRYLVQTLEGSEKQYQVVGDGMVPVKSMTLLSPGSIKA